MQDISAEQLLAEPDCSSAVPAASAVTKRAALPPASHKGSSSHEGHAGKFVSNAADEGGDTDGFASATTSGAANNLSLAQLQIGSADAAQAKPDAEAFPPLREVPGSPKQNCSSPSLSPAGPSTPESIPSIRIQETWATPNLPESGQWAACAAQEPQAAHGSASPAVEEDSWQEVRHSKHKQTPQRASVPSNARSKINSSPKHGKASPAQAGPSRLHVAPEQAQRMQGPSSAQNWLPVPKLQPVVVQHSSILPDASRDDDECVVCLDNAREVLFMTCGHMVSLLPARLSPLQVRRLWFQS